MNENLTDETQTEGAEGTQPTDTETETNQETVPTPTDAAQQPPTVPTALPVGTHTEGAQDKTLASELIALHPASKERLHSEIAGIVTQGLAIDTVLHLIGSAIQRELGG